MELSPEDIRKDKGKVLKDDFSMFITFRDFCDRCNPYTTEIIDLCEFCKNELGPKTIQDWSEVKEICDCHFYPNLE